MSAPDYQQTWEWVNAYAGGLGWRLIPIKPGGKVPSVTKWQTKATTDSDTLASWWQGRFVDAGVGIATGQESGVWVLDVDAQHDGIESLRQVRQGRDLPKGPRVDTPSGGFHLYFANPKGMHVATTKNIGQLNGHPSGLDVRGDGGQVLAPPTIHPNGKPYQWHPGRDPWSVRLPVAPDWLLGLVVPAELEHQPEPERPKPTVNESSAAEEITANHDWHTLLSNDGWICSKQGSKESLWTRPGKDPRQGVSAVLHEPEGPLVNFSSSAVNLCQPWAHDTGSDSWAYSIFGYLAATRHNGDRSALAKDWVDRRTHDRMSDWAATTALPPAKPEPEQDDDDPFDFAHLVDWGEFWSKEHKTEEWTIWPLIPKGRAIALHAAAKQGKSTILQSMVIAAVLGEPVFGVWNTEPVDVLYLDYEMTESDLFERMSELGYGPGHDFSHLHYAMLPSIFPLDSLEGASQIVRLAEAVNAQVVIIDTFSRAVKGGENESDTARDFYRYTGMALKSRGIACLRTDHSGKDAERGQRGSSAKNDDVDVVWSLERVDSGVKITRTHSRMSWTPEVIAIEQIEHDNGYMEYRIAQRRQWPAGIPELAHTMELLGIELKSSVREAARVLRVAGEGTRTERIRLAQQYRETSLTEAWMRPKPVTPSDDEDSII